jgi:hypothetical protein
VAIADLNHDRKPDLAVSNVRSNDVAVMINIGPGTVGVGDAQAASRVMFELKAPRPNPSRGPTDLRFVLPSSSLVDVTLFDLSGRRVRSLATSALMGTGEHALRWDGRDETGGRSRAGVYLARVRAGSRVEVRRVGG